MSYRNGATPTNEAPQIYNTYHRSRPTSGTSRSNFPSQHYQYSHRPSNSQRVNGHSQRPSSAGVTRDHSSSGYSRNNSNTNTINFISGNRAPGVVGSGYHSRPSSAGTTRQYSSSSKHRQNHHTHSSGHSSSSQNSGGHHTSSNHYNYSNTTGNGVSNNGNPHSKSSHRSSSSQNTTSGTTSYNSSGHMPRPKSSGSMRTSGAERYLQNANLRTHGNGTTNDKLPDPRSSNNNSQNSNNIATTRLWSSQKHIVPTNTPSAANEMSSSKGNNNNSSGTNKVEDGNTHWSTSYKQHYSSNSNSNTSTQYQVQQKIVDKTDSNGMPMPVQKHINMVDPIASNKMDTPSNSINGKSTSKVRAAIEQSQKYNTNPSTGEVPTADDNAAVDTENRGVGDENEDFEGKPLANQNNMISSQETRSQPEVSLTTPSQSTVLAGALDGGIDTRNGSLDSFHEDKMNVGLTTIPNQFCSAREALELKKLLLLSNGSRGGIVPSSTAVMDMYMVGKVIGVGSYGKVRAAWHRLTGGKVAIKTYDKSKLKDPAHWKRVHSEIKITEQVSHPRIARMYEAVETPKRMHLIMECLDGGNLCSYVKAKRRLSEEESKGIFFQLMQAIEHLHAMRVTHRDVKLENVLFDTTESKDIKIIDFGFSTICEPGSKLKVFCGTPSYMAPEIVRRTEYEGKPVDMWSMGVLLYALLCGCFPFRAKSYPDLYRRIARGTFAMPEELSVSVRDLIRQLLNVDPSRRMTAAAALRHPWLQGPLSNAPDMSKLRLLTPILISDRAADDLDDETLDQLSKFGLGKDEILRQVMNKTHSALATLYYLLLNVIMSKRRFSSNGKNSSHGRKSSSSIRSSNSHGRQSSHGHDSNKYQMRTTTGGNIAQPVQTTPQPLTNGIHRPKSAGATRSSGHGSSRPLSAYAGRQRVHQE